MSLIDQAKEQMAKTVENTKKILPVVRYYSYIEITRRAHQTLWREYEHLQSMFDNFAMQHIRDQDDIYPVFRELFHKQSATSNA